MNLIYAYSVFTHMKDDVAANAMKVLRQHISENGLLCITIRPRSYWHAHISGGQISEVQQKQKLSDHDKNGYAFISYEDNKHGGPSNWGDASYSLNYIKENWKDWEVLKYDFADSDPYQIIVFLKPV
jgi:hypothetical protein